MCSKPSLRKRTKRKTARRSTDSGVTLIEMMIVLVIIGIVAAMIVPNVIGRPDQARVAVAKSDIRSIGASLEMYRLDNRSYPTTAQSLDALAKRPTDAPIPVNWPDRGYLTSVPLDPWGHPFVYVSPGKTGDYDLTSYGADGKPGGDGVNADIVNTPPTAGGGS